MRFFLFLAFASLVFGQTQPTPQSSAVIPELKPPPPGLTTTMVYSAFFREIAVLDAKADQRKGTPSESYLRTQIQREAGLAPTEFAVLKKVALHCSADYDAEKKRGMIEVIALRQKYGGGQAPEAAQRLKELQRRVDDVIDGCIKELGDNFDKRKPGGVGRSRFASLHNWLMEKKAPKIGHGAAKVQ
jgi:hypothetical protein